MADGEVVQRGPDDEARENQRTVVGRKMFRFAGPVLMAIGLVVLLVPFSVSNDTYDIEGRSCGSALFPTYEETLSGENAVLQDWVTERDCRAAAAARSIIGTVAIVLGAFFTLAAFRQPRVLTDPSATRPPSS